MQTGEPWYDIEGLKTTLAALTYPLFFIDFETINPAIPRFAGMRPYDHMPFQWSVHVQKEAGAEPEHHEFLAMDASRSALRVHHLALRSARRKRQHRRV